MQSPRSRGTTGERSHSQTVQVPFTSELPRSLTKGSARFGTLSHHSFFSRHNPHPHRVRHIQGLNGRPVCSVRDDWFVTSSLFPHPLLKGNGSRKPQDPAFAFPLARSLSGVCSKNKSALFSEAWRDELKELAAKINLASHGNKDKKEEQPEEELVHRKTQYSAHTGRIIPTTTKSYQRRALYQRFIHPQPFHDQELMVLELLCQILQTDSLSTVQQWLLLAGQREKDLVMAMIKQAMDGIDLSVHHQAITVRHQNFHPGASPPQCGPSPDQPWRQSQREWSNRMRRSTSDDKPQKMGYAEVLEVKHLEDRPVQLTPSD